MIDTHCHIDFEEYDKDRLTVIQRAKDNLDCIINSGTSFEGNKTVLELSKKYPDFIYPSCGFHPVSSQEKTDEDLKIAKEHMIENLDEFVAIGEVGMDFFYVKDKTLRARQKEIFLNFVEIANEYEKPLLIHGRDCERKIFNMIKEYSDIPKVIFHCYSGSLKTIKRILDREDYYISFSTMLSYSEKHQELVKHVPIDRILTETDSPYLALTKEERNEPANVINAVKKISEIQEIDFEEVDKVTTKNAKYVFSIK